MQTISPSISSRLVNFSRLILTAISASVISLAAAPSTSHAAGADGVYRVTGGSGSFSGGGETVKIPKSVFSEIAKEQTAGIVVLNQKIMVNRKLTAALFKSLAEDSGITIHPKVTGPSSLKLVPDGDHFTGKTLQPIITKFSGFDDGEKFSVALKTYINVMVKGDSLTLVTRFSGTDGTDKISGTITLFGKR